MERFNAYISTLQSALQERPEVLQSVGVDLAIDVSLGVVDDLMHVILVQSVVGLQRVGEYVGILRDVCTNGGLQECLAYPLDDVGANGAVSVRPVALQQPHH